MEILNILSNVVILIVYILEIGQKKQKKEETCLINGIVLNIKKLSLLVIIVQIKINISEEKLK